MSFWIVILCRIGSSFLSPVYINKFVAIGCSGASVIQENNRDGFHLNLIDGHHLSLSVVLCT